MSASVPNNEPEQTTMVQEPKPLASVPFLHTTFLWPEGVDGECPHCGKVFGTGQRVAVLAGYIGEDARGGRGWIPLTTLA